MALLMFLTLLVLILIQLLDHEKNSYQPALRAAVIWGGIIVTSTELLSLVKAIDSFHLTLVWGVSLLAGLAWLGWRLHRGKRLPPLQKPIFDSSADLVLLILICVIVFGVLFVALKAPIQTYDSLSYHMSRVAHWAQNRSVGIYVTGIERQNMMGPFAEYVILHTYVLQHSDLLANLVDWLAYLGCILAAAFIAGRLGAGKRGQLIAAAFDASLPMAIAQASSSMTDIVVAFWVMCAIAEIVSALASGNATWRTWLYLAAAAGLAILTKTTAFAFLLPFLLWFGIKVLISRGLRWTALRMLPFLALVAVINLPFWIRNTRTYGTPLGSPALLEQHANQILTPGVLLSNTVRNLSLNFGTPSTSINHFTKAVISKLHKLVGMNVEDPRTTYNHSFSITDQIMMEDRTGNPVHLFFIFLAAGIAIFTKKYSGLVCAYSLVAISTFLLFSIGNTYQVFGNRLLVPFFLLSAPLVGLGVARFRPWLGLASGFLLVLAGLPWLLSLQSRPILPIPGQTIPTSILDTSRQELYFANVGGLGSDQRTVVSLIQDAACTQVGLMLGGDDPEYLWWVELGGAPNQNWRLEWIVSGTPSDRFADPAFKPCAVICTSCPTEWKAFKDLPLQYQSSGLRLFLKSKP
jgi:hypothetical protein